MPISQLLATDKPDLVLIVMGDTMASYTKPAFPKAWLWQQTTGLTKAIAANGTVKVLGRAELGHGRRQVRQELCPCRR